MKELMGKCTLLSCISIWLLPISVGYGQVLLSPAFEKTEADENETMPKTSFTIHPRASPDPKLHYRLWPAPEKRRPRPAMVAVNRALLLVAQVSAKQKRQFLESYDEWSVVPIDEVPIDKAKASYQAFEVAIGVLRSGENWMDLRYDLGLEDMSSQEKTATLLPEYQEMRDLARLLCMRARVASAEKRWDDAISDLRLGFRLSEVASHGTDTLLSRLIGIAIAEVLMDTIEAMIQDPECPNLYWALAGLPVDRLFEMREAVLRASDFELSRIRDNWLAWSSLPLELWDDYQTELDEAVEISSRSINIGARFARMLLPAVQRAEAIGLQAKQKHHRLITLEALRLHAAQSGSLPDSIDKLHPAPAWKDPLARKSFGYVRASQTRATIVSAEGTRNRDDLTLQINLQVKR